MLRYLQRFYLFAGRLTAFARLMWRFTNANDIKSLSSSKHTLVSSGDILTDAYNLARGRWESYRELRVPQFTVGLDKDTEAMLDHHVYDLCEGFNVSFLVHTHIKIGICENMFAQNLNVSDYLHAYNPLSKTETFKALTTNLDLDK